MLQHLKLALRQWRTHPGFSATVVVTLALAIGANTAIFSVVNALLLKSLPYAQPERLGTVYVRGGGTDPFDERHNIDGQQWELLRDDVPSLISAAYSPRVVGANLEASSGAQYLHDGRVSAHFFDVLGIHPILGRNFTEDEDRPHGPKAAILSFALWRTAFGSNPDELGKTVLLKGEPYTVIGVLPQRATTPLNADVYTPLQASREGEGGGTNFADIVRLRDGASWQQANAELNRAWSNSKWVQWFHGNNPGAPLEYYTVALQKGQTDKLRPQVLALMLAAGFILLIACANLAGLTLVRILRRNSEIATRLALGASAWQIQKQLWIENLLLALAGAAAGVAVAFICIRALLLLLPQGFLPVASVALDVRVLGFSLGVALLTSVLFGMLPALTARKVDLRASITGSLVSGARGIRLRQNLIAGEVALTVVLLAASGLLIRTLVHLETLPPGFNPNGLITAKASLDDVRYHDPAAFRKLLSESIAAMRQIPGVQNAAVALTVPYERPLIDSFTFRDGPRAGHHGQADEIYVTPGYFETLQVPLLSGRTFTDADGPDAQPVAVVNRTFAHKFFPGMNPVGMHLDTRTIIGVVGDIVVSSAGQLNEGSEPLTEDETLYVPAAQETNGKSLAVLHVWFQPSWIVRTSAPVSGLNGQMQRALASIDPNLPFSGFYSMKDVMAETLAMQRVEVALLAAMAALALLLSAIGIFGLVANTVAQKTREIGIRIALGSTIERAMIHVGSSGILASSLGLLLGLLLCAGVLRAMRSVVYGVGIYDAKTMLFAIVTLGGITLLATTVPVLRIARIDPAKTLRQE